jgi:ssDNA-binding replication factor A large subunit
MADLTDKVVRLSINSAGLAVPDQDPVEVNRHNQKIRWAADFQFTIDIEGYSDVKHSTNGSGDGERFTAKTGYFTGQHHKYSITANGKVNDPDISVRP